MSVREMIEEARTLSVEEQKQLAKALVDMLAEALQDTHHQRRSLREFRGLGAHLYDGTDAQHHVNQLRSEWDDRP